MPSFAELRASKRGTGRAKPLVTRGKRQYAAAKVNRLTGDWLPVGQTVNDILRTSAPAVTRRVRQLVRDFPYLARAANIMVDLTVGTGTTFQSRVLNPEWQPGAKGVAKFNRKICQQIEDAVAWGMEELDVAGRLHGFDLERLAKSEEVEAGEFIFVKRYLKEPTRFIPFCLQPIEAEWLSGYNAKADKAMIIDNGVEYDPSTGRIVACHLSDPSSIRHPERIPAEYVIRGFNSTRSGQLRGISPFVTAVLIAHDLADYLDATIDTAKLAAKHLAFVKVADRGGRQGGVGVAGTGADEGKVLEEMENAIIEYLRPGEDIILGKSDPVSSTFDPFTKFVLRTVAIATGTPYSALAGSHADYNYTSLRGERQDTLKSFAPHQDRHVRQFKQPVVREIITSAVMVGKLNLPGYFNDPRPYWRGLYLPPGMEPVDPLKEITANKIEIEQGINSPQRIAAKRGIDVEDILDDLSEFYEMAEERGLPFGQTSVVVQVDANDDSIDEPAPSSGLSKDDVQQLKMQADAYGVGVRAGMVTPQKDDEQHFRDRAGLPEMSDDVESAWTDDGGVRRPITLQSGEAFEAEQGQIAAASEDEETEDA